MILGYFLLRAGAIVRQATQRPPLKRHLRAAGAILSGCGRACLGGGVCLSSGRRAEPRRRRARSQACAPCGARRQRDVPAALAPRSTPHRGRRCPPDVRARHPYSVPPLSWWWWVHPAGSLLLVPSQPALVGGVGEWCGVVARISSFSVVSRVLLLFLSDCRLVCLFAFGDIISAAGGCGVGA